MPLKTRFENTVMQGVLLELGLMLEGHFDFGNGYHGTTYLNAHPLLHDPYKIMQYAQDLRDAIPSEIRDETDMVVGPITGGMALAMMLAIAIDTQRSGQTAKRVMFAPIYKEDGKFRMRKHYRDIISGKTVVGGPKRVIIADDVCNTGFTINSCRDLVMDSRGIVLASAVLYDRASVVSELANHYALGEADDDPGLVRAEECPYCQGPTKTKISEF